LSGIYILQTSDGFRVSFSRRYEDLVSLDENVEYQIDGKLAKLIFGECYRYRYEEEALEHAKEISRMHPNMDDGIRFIRYAQDKTFKELTRG
jgi:hypothetical protein